MHSELTSVRELHQVDRRRRELSAEIAHLPKHISEIENKLKSHREKLESDQATLEENHKRRRQMEGEIAAQEQKNSRLREQMSEAKTNDQFRAFQHEIKFAEDEIRKIEDRILDGMEEAEALDQLVGESKKSLELEAQSVEKEVREAQARVAKDEEELSTVEVQRKKLAASISPQVLGTYERVQKMRGGEAVAEASADRCFACNVVLRPQFSQMLRFGQKVMTCESCGRILYYVPPDEGPRLEDPAGESNVAPNNRPA